MKGSTRRRPKSAIREGVSIDSAARGIGDPERRAKLDVAKCRPS